MRHPQREQEVAVDEVGEHLLVCRLVVAVEDDCRRRRFGFGRVARE
ncbi:hypothetical protein [Streptomyces marianii]|nr:hypothetical protein [Streptomyces marianii]